MDVIYIVGVGRSGTSALTRVLALCGASLPPRLLRPSPANVKGYWEPEVALKRNDQFLKAIGSAYHDPSLAVIDAAARRGPSHTLFEKNIAEFFAGLPNAGAVAIKEPRISGLLDFWIAGAERLGHSVKIVHIFRHPDDVTASLRQRYQIADELSQALWLKYNLMPERATRHLPRVFVSYTQLLSDWRAVIDRCNQAWGTGFAADDNAVAAIREFLSADQRHHDTPSLAPLNDLSPRRWVSRVYGALQTSTGGAIDIRTMDTVYGEKLAADRFFKSAYDAYLAKFGPAAGGASAEQSSSAPVEQA